MKKNILVLLMILTYIGIVFFINHKIETDLSYHYGKDGGIFSGLKMIVILSSVYFFVLTGHNKLFFLLLGFIIGILSFLVSYFTLFALTNFNDIYFYLFAMLISIISFHLLERQIKNSKLRKTGKS